MLLFLRNKSHVFIFRLSCRRFPFGNHPKVLDPSNKTNLDLWIVLKKKKKKKKKKHQGPVVQSIVSLTSSLRGQLVKCFMTFKPNTILFYSILSHNLGRSSGHHR